MLTVCLVLVELLVQGASGGAVTAGTQGGSGRNGNLADNVVSSALRYRAHQPFLDSLLKEIGMKLQER